uniref:phosphoenolpyruvate mutase n=1 Tax=Streptomyces sp. MMG1612 TaxID=1415547 RepID=U5YR05_9ACTN|nr:PEP mutase [Streptomyces sp. MMG1612]
MSAAESPRATAPPPRARLRALIDSPRLSFLMEAHDGLSARIAEAEGFEGIWASGLSMATALGLRDSDEATWSQLLDVVEYMTEAVSVPVLVDGDTGYGNFNTARRFARAAERIGAAGICLEDKVFPKMNSFVGDRHQLADLHEFTARLYACREAVSDADFTIVARTEALIAGQGMPEALKRAEAYREAGADAIFIHSRRADADEIARFAAEWGGRLPLVISPTTYATTPTEDFRAIGVSTVLWANHSMRAAVGAMRTVCRRIRAEESVHGVDAGIAAVSEVFDLLDYAELEDTERRLMGRR